MTEVKRRARGAQAAELSAKLAAVQGELDAQKLQMAVREARLLERATALQQAAEKLAELLKP